MSGYVGITYYQQYYSNILLFSFKGPGLIIGSGCLAIKKQKKVEFIFLINFQKQMKKYLKIENEYILSATMNVL